MLDQVFNQWLQYYYLPSETAIQNYSISPIIPAQFLVFSFIIMRIVDAIADPIVGYISDNSKAKIGKRSYYMLIGIIPLALSMILFFYPLKSSVAIAVSYMSFIGSIYFIAYTLVGGPYNALVADLSTTREERLNLSTIQSVFRLIFTAFPLILSPKIFGILIKKGYSFSDSIRYMVIGFSVISAILVIISIFGIKEKLFSKENSDRVEVNFWGTLKYLKNREIILYFLGFFFFFSGFNIIRNCVSYYVTAFLELTEAQASLPTTILFLASALFFPVTQKLTKKYGYKLIMLADLILIILGTIGLILLGKLAILRYLMFIIIGMGISGSAFIFPPAMLSEITNSLHNKYKVNIEGTMFGIQGLFLKLAMLTQVVCTTLLLTISTKTGGATSIGVIVTLFVAILLLVLSFICYFLKKSEI